MKNLLSKIEREKLDDLPTKDKIRIPADRWGRYRQDYPHTKVWRFFRSQVGHNWDEVYSKYCKLDWIPKQYKNMEQVRWVVTVDTFLKDGKVCFIDRFSGESTVESTYYHKEVLYVHPETKTLCLYSGKHVDWKKKRAEEEAKTLKILGDYHQLLKLNGIWYEVKGEPVKPNIVKIDGLHWRITDRKPSFFTRTCIFNGKVFSEIIPPDGPYKIIDGKIAYPCSEPSPYNRTVGPKDRMIKDNVKRPVWTWRDVDTNSVKIILFKQLNHKELKYHGLTNDTPVDGTVCKKCGGISGKTCLYGHRHGHGT